MTDLVFIFGMAALAAVCVVVVASIWAIRDVSRMNGSVTIKERIARDNWMEKHVEKLLALRVQDQERVAALHAQERVIARTNDQVTERMATQMEAAMNQPAAADAGGDESGIPVARPEDAAFE